jgi:hypothetical protein
VHLSTLFPRSNQIHVSAIGPSSRLLHKTPKSRSSQGMFTYTRKRTRSLVCFCEPDRSLCLFVCFLVRVHAKSAYLYISSWPVSLFVLFLVLYSYTNYKSQTWRLHFVTCTHHFTRSKNKKKKSLLMQTNVRNTLTPLPQTVCVFGKITHRVQSRSLKYHNTFYCWCMSCNYENLELFCKGGFLHCCIMNECRIKTVNSEKWTTA